MSDGGKDQKGRVLGQVDILNKVIREGLTGPPEDDGE